MTHLIQTRVDALLARCRAEVDEGRIPGCQVAVGFRGEVAVFEAFGDVTTANRLHTYSAVKPTVSLTVLELAADGFIDLRAPVADLIPEFASNGKHVVTVSQVLLHAGGFPSAPMPPALWADRRGRLERYAKWRLNWEPGTRYEYHPSSAQWVLADLITAVTGRPYADVITERVMEPAGVPRFLAIPVADQADIADVVSVGDAPDMAARAAEFGFEIPETEVTDDALLIFNDPELRAAGNPGGGGIASAADFALWYQAILHDDGEILHPEAKHDALEVVRQNHADWMGVTANRTRAFVLGGDDGQSLMRGYGHTTGPCTFGHGGAKGQRGWADSSTGISLGFMTNGLDRDDFVHAHRCAAISSLAGALTTPDD